MGRMLGAHRSPGPPGKLGGGHHCPGCSPRRYLTFSSGPSAPHQPTPARLATSLPSAEAPCSPAKRTALGAGMAAHAWRPHESSGEGRGQPGRGEVSWPSWPQAPMMGSGAGKWGLVNCGLGRPAKPAGDGTGGGDSPFTSRRVFMVHPDTCAPPHVRTHARTGRGQLRPGPPRAPQGWPCVCSSVKETR